MIRNVLLDAGPLVALVNARDRRHEWVRLQLRDIIPPLLTCEAVVSEACFVAQRAHAGVPGILGMLERGAAELAFDLNDHFKAVASLMRRYADVPMSVADACLVRMSEVVPDCTLLTLDGDFRIYRRHGRKTIPLLIPPDV